ncbi:MAG: TIGR03086 family metal-binding protein [Actinomycetota bacterium]|nr:TIGR03086 family metal-binding protein [Actinomycetota bacterium]
MTNAPTLTDPRPFHRDAVRWLDRLAAGVHPGQMGDPTPCDEFDVRTLLAHLVSVARKLRATAEGADITDVPHVSPGIEDGALAGTWSADAHAMLDAWSDDALLDLPVRVPWGRVSGREALQGYLNELLVHGWDLAVATGRDPEADPTLVAYAMEAITRLLPAEGRAGSRFDPVVTPAPDAGPSERLANWSGRARPADVG